MMTDQVDLDKENAPADPGADTGSRRSPVIVFLGFLFLGIALALVLFGGDLFSGGSEKTAPEPGAVLNQVTDITDLAQGAPPGSSLADLASQPEGSLTVGDRAHPFTLNNLDGSSVSLADYQGKPVIVNFWASWCAPCRIEMPALQAAYDENRDKGLVILALDQDEPAEVARQFFYEEMNLSFIPLLDEDNDVSTAYGTFGALPTTYFIDRAGLVTAIHRGPLTTSQIDGYLADILTEG